MEIPLNSYKAVSVHNSRDTQKNLKHYDVIWEDRDVRYDINSKQLKLRNGEFIVDKLHVIENTKGNRENKDSFFCAAISPNMPYYHKLSSAEFIPLLYPLQAEFKARIGF
ncbi:bardet-Biedl syndrome 5 protein [Trichinella spiralis]|uniref:bardet-Biedl syndrome 5 protein n=1 Tax=Trichinella spiralis TaxID=6334 RepID=UPI0001EFE096|nr:bardet-Biedl syndrome 5 protein [Trichinella spiralis]